VVVQKEHEFLLKQKISNTPLKKWEFWDKVKIYFLAVHKEVIL
jgi:hypothetical protein